jgi:pimeloyl-ACP methyl ester carboxylesterase
MRTVASSLQSVAALALLALASCANVYRLSAHGTPVDVGGDRHVWTYRLDEPGRPSKPPAAARAFVFYLTGSLHGGAEQTPVTSAMGSLAGFSMMGMQVVLVDRRGIEPDGTDLVFARRFADKPTRVADALAAMRRWLRDVPPSMPVLLVGASEGADVAVAVAAAEPRVTHLILLCGGGGMTQAAELRLLVDQHPGLFGRLTSQDLDAAFTDIHDHPDADTLWLGQPYRRWSTFLWSAPLPDLLSLRIPIFIGQGDADTAVPVESARAAARAFRDAGKNNLRYAEYAGFDHSFRFVARGVSGLPRVEMDIVAWLGERGILSAGEVGEFQRRVRAAHPDLF